MGSGQSENKHHQLGGIHISIENQNITSGDFLIGSVHIQLKETIASPQLLLIFKGSEIVDFQTRHTRQVGKTTQVYYLRHTGKNVLFDIRAILFQWPDMIALAGNYSFPFQLKTFENSLPTFHVPITYFGHAKIHYTIKAQLNSQGSATLKFKHPISMITRTVSIPPDLLPVNLSNEIAGTGRVCWCCKPETAHAKVWIERPTYASNDIMEISVETNLADFTYNATRIEIEVKKIVTVTANKERPMTHVQSFSMWKNSFQNLQILAFSPSTLNHFKIPIQDILKSESSYTFRCQLIACQFVIHVKVHTEYRCCKCSGFPDVNQSFVILPFQIIYPVAPPPIAPEIWQSQVSKLATINLENRDQNNLEIIRNVTYNKDLIITNN